MSIQIKDYEYILCLCPHKYLLDYIANRHPNKIHVKEINIIETYNDGIREVEYKFKGGRDNISTETEKFVLTDDIVKEVVLAYGEKQKTQYSFDQVKAMRETIKEAQNTLDEKIKSISAATILLDLDKFRHCADDFTRNKKAIVLNTLLSMKFAHKIYYNPSNCAVYINHKNSIEVDCIINYDHASYSAAARSDLFTLLNAYVDSLNITARDDVDLSYNLYEINFDDLKDFARYLPVNYNAY